MMLGKLCLSLRYDKLYAGFVIVTIKKTQLKDYNRQQGLMHACSVTVWEEITSFIIEKKALQQTPTIHFMASGSLFTSLQTALIVL